MSEERIKCAHLEPNTVYVMVDGEMVKVADIRKNGWLTNELEAQKALLRECLPHLERFKNCEDWDSDWERELIHLISRVEKAVG